MIRGRVGIEVSDSRTHTSWTRVSGCPANSLLLCCSAAFMDLGFKTSASGFIRVHLKAKVYGLHIGPLIETAAPTSQTANILCLTPLNPEHPTPKGFHSFTLLLETARRSQSSSEPPLQGTSKSCRSDTAKPLERAMAFTRRTPFVLF